MTLTTAAAAEPLHHHGYKWAKGMRGRQAWRGRTSTHTFSYFLFTFSHSYSTNGKEGLPPPSQLLTHRLHALVTTRGGHPPLSALFLALDPTRGGRSPLLPCFLTLVTTRKERRLSSVFLCWTQHGEVVLPSRHILSHSSQQEKVISPSCHVFSHSTHKGRSSSPSLIIICIT